MTIDTDWLLVDQHAIALIDAEAWTTELADSVSNDVDEILWRHGYRMEPGYIPTPTVRKLSVNYALRALFMSVIGIRDSENDGLYKEFAQKYDSEYFSTLRTLTYTNIVGDN